MIPNGDLPHDVYGSKAGDLTAIGNSLGSRKRMFQNFENPRL